MSTKQIHTDTIRGKVVKMWSSCLCVTLDVLLIILVVFLEGCLSTIIKAFALSHHVPKDTADVIFYCSFLVFLVLNILLLSSSTSSSTTPSSFPSTLETRCLDTPPPSYSQVSLFSFCPPCSR